MGFTEVRIHVRKKETSDIEKLYQYLGGMGLSVELIQQKDYLTMDSQQVSFENFEEIAMGISKELALNVLVSFVFDSDIAVLQGYVDGDKAYEEMKSFGENQEMDREIFLKEFFPSCNNQEFSAILDRTDYVFAEDCMFELGNVLGIELFEM